MAFYFKPKQFGKYLLLDRIAVGGMAEIYKAKQFGISGFEKLIVIKKILPHLTEDKEFIDMFIDEAKISVSLSHSNIAQVYELGQFDSQYFIAMECIEGKNLREILKKCIEKDIKVSIDQALFITTEICKALDYAHRKSDSYRDQSLNIIHRDISPQNIMLSYEGEVKIVDFGIAKAEDKLSKTQAGILKGKFSYMSPEQSRGLEIDAKSDIFSTGILFWELLTGERLFIGETDFDTLENVKRCKVPSPSKFNANVPKELDKIALKALEKDINRRYQAASDMQIDLTKYLYKFSSDFTSAKLSSFLKSLFKEEIQKERARLNEILKSIKINGNLFDKDYQSKIISSKDVSGAPSQKEDKPKQFFDSESYSPYMDSQGSISSEDTGFYGSSDVSVFGDKEPSGFKALLTSKKFWFYAGAIILILGLTFTFFKGGMLGPKKKKKERKVVQVSFGLLSVTSDPSDAQVFIEEKNGSTTEIGSTPIISYKLKTGEYKLRVSKKGYNEVRDAIYILPNKEGEPPTIKKRNYQLIKKILYGSLRIDSEPQGARISINGIETGKVTPAIISDLIVGREYEVVLVKEFYHDHTERIRIESEMEKGVSYKMGIVTGRIKVSSKPRGAAIFINDEKFGKTPLEIPDIIKGKVYTVVVSLNKDRDYNKAGKRVVLEDPTRTLDVHFDLKAKPKYYGHLFFQAKPWAYVHIDGRNKGTTPQNVKLRTGRHTIKLTNPNYKPIVKKVTIKKNANLKVIGNMINATIEITD